MVGEYERAFYGSQYAAMAPLFEHYGLLICGDCGRRMESAWSNRKPAVREGA